MKTAKHLPKFLVQAIKASRGSEKSRYCSNYIHAKDNRIAATDGHVLLVVDFPDEELEEGLYELQGDCLVKSDADQRFPRYTDLLDGFERAYPPIELSTDSLPKSLLSMLIKTGLFFDVFLYEKLLRALSRNSTCWSTMLVRQANEQSFVRLVQYTKECLVQVALMPYAA